MNAPDITQAIASTAAEQAVLATLLQANEAFDHVAPILAPADFYSGDHQAVYRAIAALIESGKPADVITVGQWLKDRNELGRLGGMAFLAELQTSLGSASSVLHYARDVREQATRRAIFQVSMKLGDMATYADGRDSRKMLDEAQALLAAVDERSQRGRGTFEALGSVLTRVVENIDAAVHADKPIGHQTGFDDLDRILNRMAPGQLIVVGARPKVGKTSFAVNVGMHIASQGDPVYMFSMEMTGEEVGTRVLSGHTCIAAGRLREHRISDEHWNAIGRSVSKLADVPFYIDASPALSIQSMRARARVQLKQLGRPPALIIVDYLQLSGSEGRFDTRAGELGAVTSGLKQLAKEIGSPVMALSQLNRDSSKAGKKPEMHELRDSGSIEADADAILLLHRDYVVSQRQEQMYDAEVNVAAQRNGQIGPVPLDYDPPLTRFFNYGAAPHRRGDRAPAGYSAAKSGD